MSVVGYVLGLGDRHPSNIMLNEKNGKIVHIDLGDCFEQAMDRESFPELIPFRLTRMMVKAMEVTGINGIYRKTCIDVMNILRKESHIVKLLLEAFIHDPLTNWSEAINMADDENELEDGDYEDSEEEEDEFKDDDVGSFEMIGGRSRPVRSSVIRKKTKKNTQ